jgi:hypothetical protein
MPDRLTPWRRYSDLNRTEKKRVRVMYEAGDNVTGIAQRLHVYAGTITNAAVKGAWSRKKNAKSIAARIAAALAKRPTSTNAELADLTGGKASYVSAVRRRLKGRQE